MRLNEKGDHPWQDGRPVLRTLYALWLRGQPPPAAWPPEMGSNNLPRPVTTAEIRPNRHGPPAALGHDCHLSSLLKPGHKLAPRRSGRGRPGSEADMANHSPLGFLEDSRGGIKRVVFVQVSQLHNSAVFSGTKR